LKSIVYFQAQRDCFALVTVNGLAVLSLPLCDNAFAVEEMPESESVMNADPFLIISLTVMIEDFTLQKAHSFNTDRWKDFQFLLCIILKCI